jgi:hypothetical protein
VQTSWKEVKAVENAPGTGGGGGAPHGWEALSASVRPDGPKTHRFSGADHPTFAQTGRGLPVGETARSPEPDVEVVVVRCSLVPQFPSQAG